MANITAQRSIISRAHLIKTGSRPRCPDRRENCCTQKLSPRSRAAKFPAAVTKRAARRGVTPTWLTPRLSLRSLPDLGPPPTLRSLSLPVSWPDAAGPEEAAGSSSKFKSLKSISSSLPYWALILRLMLLRICEFIGTLILNFDIISP